jgi:uncharacterized protein (DUF2141 family)
VRPRIAAFHDRNANGKLDMRWFPLPKPKEGGGISGNNMGHGRPQYRKARFSVPGDSVAHRIAMRY